MRERKRRHDDAHHPMGGTGKRGNRKAVASVQKLGRYPTCVICGSEFYRTSDPHKTRCGSCFAAVAMNEADGELA